MQEDEREELKDAENSHVEVQLRLAEDFPNGPIAGCLEKINCLVSNCSCKSIVM